MARLLTEHSFKDNAIRMKIAARSQGGRKRVVDIIENAFIHYSANDKPMQLSNGTVLLEPSHLVDKEFNFMATQICFNGCCCFYFIVVSTFMYILLEGWIGFVPGINQSMWQL